LAAWILLVYKVPSEPSARRVYVWRKLKRLGAVSLQDAIWVLPANPRTLEQFQWLAAEIVEFGGSATVWNARPAFSDQDETLARQFVAQADEAYRELLAGLERPDADFAALSRRYQQIKAADYFNSSLGQRVREVLIAARGDTEL
jgi:hypothetical protein